MPVFVDVKKKSLDDTLEGEIEMIECDAFFYFPHHDTKYKAQYVFITNDDRYDPPHWHIEPIKEEGLPVKKLIGNSDELIYSFEKACMVFFELSGRYNRLKDWFLRPEGKCDYYFDSKDSYMTRRIKAPFEH